MQTEKDVESKNDETSEDQTTSSQKKERVSLRKKAFYAFVIIIAFLFTLVMLYYQFRTFRFSHG